MKHKLYGFVLMATAVLEGCSMSPMQAQPSSPTNVIASAAPGYVHVTWDLVPNADHYKIFRNKVTPGQFLDETMLAPNSSTNPVLGYVPGTQTSWNDTSAQVGTLYMYSVVSDNASGQSSLHEFTNYSCGTAFAANDTGNHPAVRPLVYLAGHGTNGVTAVDGSGNSTYYPDPNPSQVTMAGYSPLLQTNGVGWENVASCLDGIWGNYARVSSASEQTLYGLVNTRNTIAEQDISVGGALANPTTNASLNPPNLTLNRRGMEIYTEDPAALGHTPDANNPVDTTLVGLRAKYSNGSSPAESYARIYTGFNLNRWVAPYSQTSGIPPGNPGVYTFNAATTVFEHADGNIQECGRAQSGASTCDNGNVTIAFQHGFLNNFIQTHVNGGDFILFFAVGATGAGTGIGKSGYPKTGALTELQNLYNFISSQPCSGTYDAPGGAGTHYDFCNANRDPGLWRRGDVVLIINYQGWYPPTPAYTQGAADDNVAGLLHWLISQ